MWAHGESCQTIGTNKNVGARYAPKSVKWAILVAFSTLTSILKYSLKTFFYYYYYIYFSVNGITLGKESVLLCEWFICLEVRIAEH